MLLKPVPLDVPKEWGYCWKVSALLIQLLEWALGSDCTDTSLSTSELGTHENCAEGSKRRQSFSETDFQWALVGNRISSHPSHGSRTAFTAAPMLALQACLRVGWLFPCWWKTNTNPNPSPRWPISPMKLMWGIDNSLAFSALEEYEWWNCNLGDSTLFVLPSQ